MIRSEVDQRLSGSNSKQDWTLHGQVVLHGCTCKHVATPH